MEARDSFCFPKNTQNPNPSPIGKKFGFCACGAPPGTRTLGPLIKSATPASNVHFVNRELSSIFDGASFLYWSFALHRSANFAPRVNHCTG